MLIGVATQSAGPAVVLSFLIGGLVTLLNALCFTEYAAKTPKTGAQYTYMYETIGEGVAFLVGWTLAIGYTSAFSLAARGWSGYFDSLFNHAIRNYTMTHIPYLKGTFFPEYPDFIAIVIILVVMFISSIGVNFSSKVNTVLAAVSGCLLIFIACAGFFFADSKNWFGQEGGFFPHGISGVFKAAAACFYAFQGFEIIGFSSEETENPKKVIPRAMIATFGIVTLLYMGVSISFSLMIPYTHINKNAPFPGAFAYHNMDWIKYIVAIGPMFALFNLCILELYTISRTIYSMSTDGLLFKFCSRVNERSKVPLGPIMVFGPVVIVLVLLTDLEDLLGFMVMFTFIQYSFFASYMIVLRYNPPILPAVKHIKETDENEVEIKVNSVESQDDNQTEDVEGDSEVDRDTERLINHADDGDINLEPKERSEFESSSKNTNRDRTRISNGVNRSKLSKVTDLFTVTKLVIIIYIACFFLALQLILGGGHIAKGNGLSIFSALTLSLIILMSSLGIFCRKQQSCSDGFQVPLMPFLPVLSILCNMVMLVSVANTGNVIAASTMAGIGAVLYIVMILADIIRNPDKGVSDDISTGEYSQLLTVADGEDLDDET